MADPPAPVLELAGAARRFGSRTALHPVSLRLGAGTVCLVHGANGSGKTTLLRVIAGLLVPTCGTRHVRGDAVYLRPGGGARARQRVREAVRVAARLAGDGTRVERALDRSGLGGLADQRVGTLSAGQRARLVAALALVVRPAVACLDEPVAHLDEAGAEVVRGVVRELAADGCAVVVASPERLRFDAGPDARLVVADGVVRVAP